MNLIWKWRWGTHFNCFSLLWYSKYVVIVCYGRFHSMCPSYTTIIESKRCKWLSILNALSYYYYYIYISLDFHRLFNPPLNVWIRKYNLLDSLYWYPTLLYRTSWYFNIFCNQKHPWCDFSSLFFWKKLQDMSGHDERRLCLHFWNWLEYRYPE